VSIKQSGNSCAVHIATSTTGYMNCYKNPTPARFLHSCIPVTISIICRLLVFLLLIYTYSVNHPPRETQQVIIKA